MIIVFRVYEEIVCLDDLGNRQLDHFADLGNF